MIRNEAWPADSLLDYYDTFIRTAIQATPYASAWKLSASSGPLSTANIAANGAQMTATNTRMRTSQ